MKLKTYLHETRRKGETKDSRYIRFAESLGVSLHAVRKWLNGERRINDSLKIEIQKRTGGVVTINDLVRM